MEIGGQTVSVFDEISLDINTAPKLGDEFDYEFSNELEENQSWEELFARNPEKRIGLEQLEGCEYLAFGEVISVDPVQVDCGVFIQANVFHTHDHRVIGEFIGFKISQLGGYAI